MGALCGFSGTVTNSIIFKAHTNMMRTVSLILAVISIQGSSALKCYQCISIECPQSTLFCDGVKEYVLSQLPDLYYGFQGQRVLICPSPTDKEAWEALRSSTKYECEEEKADDATCVLGRFRVTTEIFDTGKNITSYGTSMGCAKLALLKQTRQAVTKGECDMSSSSSRFKHSLRHYLDIEHCARLPDMCHKNDFCVPPYATSIKKFQEEDGRKNKTFSFTLVLGIFLVIALAVIVLTFLAPFLNG